MGGVLWKTFIPHTFYTGGRRNFEVKGPYCPRDKAELFQRTSNSAVCPLCETGYDITPSIEALNLKADIAWKAQQEKGTDIIHSTYPQLL